MQLNTFSRVHFISFIGCSDDLSATNCTNRHIVHILTQHTRPSACLLLGHHRMSTVPHELLSLSEGHVARSRDGDPFGMRVCDCG